ncbi:AAA family ATPase [Mycoplasmopsis pulmonis]|uniref:AAA family ATPase n=1 Tax=Mycoplasmopsis pulmonis TaxID=2107 RepID=UPI002ACDC043|nr:AAA family ATPase [Mycoplasmopsis pulmonis]MDZ7293746.1 AAA family ATPase [Mycoplasmopsis pulmonis]
MNSAIKYIDNLDKTNKISHSYIIKSSANVDLNYYVLYFVNKLLKLKLENLNKDTLPINVLLLEEDDVSKENLIISLKKLSLSPIVGGQKKILIIKDIEKSSKQMINALLKTLEEPSPNVVILLVTNNFHSIISTIRSRCQIIAVSQPDIQELKSFVKTLNYQSEFEKIYLEIYKNKDDLAKMINLENDNLIKDFIKAIGQSKKSKYNLVLFLEKNLNKKNCQFVSKLAHILFKLIWSEDQNFKISKIKNTFEKLKSMNINFSEISLIFDSFFKKSQTSLNFFILKEKLMISIMDIYG